MTTVKCCNALLVLKAVGVLLISLLHSSVGFLMPLDSRAGYLGYNEKSGSLFFSVSSDTTGGNSPLFDQGESFSIRKYKHKRWNLAYLYKPPSPGNESKPPVVLIHPVGVGLSSWFWVKIMKEYDSRKREATQQFML